MNWIGKNVEEKLQSKAKWTVDEKHVHQLYYWNDDTASPIREHVRLSPEGPNEISFGGFICDTAGALMQSKLYAFNSQKVFRGTEPEMAILKKNALAVCLFFSQLVCVFATFLSACDTDSLMWLGLLKYLIRTVPSTANLFCQHAES